MRSTLLDYFSRLIWLQASEERSVITKPENPRSDQHQHRQRTRIYKGRRNRHHEWGHVGVGAAVLGASDTDWDNVVGHREANDGDGRPIFHLGRQRDSIGVHKGRGKRVVTQLFTSRVHQ